jgi:hypothetical protein
MWGLRERQVVKKILRPSRYPVKKAYSKHRCPLTIKNTKKDRQLVNRYELCYSTNYKYFYELCEQFSP